MSHTSDHYPDPSTVAITHLRTAAAAVIVDDRGRVLLQKRSDNGHWGLPGGAIEPGETVSAAVIREVLEETTCTIAIDRLLGIYSDPANHQVVRYPDGNVVHYIVITFICRIVSGSPAPTDESLALEWFPPTSLPEPMVPPHRTRLADFASGRHEPFIR